MSSTLSAPSASGSASSCATADFSRFPSNDIFCAVGSTTGVPSNTSAVFDKCCKSAPVESFNNNCGYYCLSVQQTVAELQACFMKEGATPAQIFCNGNQTASATGSPSRTGGARPTGSGASASGSAGAGGNASGGAAQGVSKTGLGVLGMVFSAVMAGALL